MEIVKAMDGAVGRIEEINQMIRQIDSAKEETPVDYEYYMISEETAASAEKYRLLRKNKRQLLNNKCQVEPTTCAQCPEK